MAGEERPRELNVYLAKKAEQAERYEDMADFMRKAVKQRPELSVEERNLLSVAYKNVVGAKRSAWRVITAQMEKADNVKEEKYISMELKEKCKKQIEKELIEICGQIISLLDDTLIKHAEEDEAKVFFNKMKGDYYRYEAEISESEADAEKAKDAYKAAAEIAKDLPCTSPIRLGLALNFSVFYYEILKDQDEACKQAKKAFDDAIAEIETLKEDTYKDSTLIMQLLRDNLTLWTADAEDTKVEDMEDQ